MREIFLLSRDPQVAIRLVVVRRDIAVRNGPIFTVAVVRSRFEIEIGKAQGEPSPNIGLAAKATRAHPGVTRTGERMILFVHYDVLAVVAAIPALHIRSNKG